MTLGDDEIGQQRLGPPDLQTPERTARGRVKAVATVQQSVDRAPL
jgi:hypothetical protein